MRGVYLRTLRLRDQPVPGDGNVTHPGHVCAETLLPGREIHRAWIRRQHDELSERYTCPFGYLGGRTEGGRAVARQAENERAEHMHPVLAERLQLVHQRLAGVVEALVDVFESFGRHRLDPDEGPLDVGAPHR